MAFEDLEQLIDKWLLRDKDLNTAGEIRSLSGRTASPKASLKHAEGELERRLRNHIQFSTARLRGRMQAGFTFTVRAKSVVKA
jgi:phosphoglucomutase